MAPAIKETDFPELNLLKRGKVRDMYDLGDSLLMVATDRMSAFDVVMPDPIPDKGIILTQISLFWFELLQSLIPNHVIASHVEDFPPNCQQYAEMLHGRSLVVQKAEPLAIECVVRGYISGSGWKGKSPISCRNRYSPRPPKQSRAIMTSISILIRRQMLSAARWLKKFET
jgi:phosphoribosylaminoimidazole-succinocarboxamide synthase